MHQYFIILYPATLI